MSKTLKFTFLIHAVVGVLFGAPLLIIPGRFLWWIGWQAMLQGFGWQNTDPFMSRMMGAVLLALAWSSFRGWRATERAQVAILVETEVLFTVLGCVGLLRHLLPLALATGWYPAIAWTVFAILAIFAIAWIASLLKK